MFDFTSSKLLILGIVALIVIGPKDLPALLRTIGKYVGIIKRQAAEFRAQFDEAMRESELAELKKDVEGLGREAETAIREAEKTVETEMRSAETEVQGALDQAEGKAPPAWEPAMHDANGIPTPPPADLNPPAAAPAKPLETAGAGQPAEKGGV